MTKTNIRRDTVPDRPVLSRTRRNVRLVVSLALLLTTFGSTTPAAFAALKPFAVRFKTNAPGDILLVANTLMTCQGTDTACTGVRNGTAAGSNANNNDFNTMVYVDVDADSTTFDSSSATLTLPSGGSVLWAGLYWGGISNTTPDPIPPRTKVKLRAPGQASYVNLTGTLIGSEPYINSIDAYHVFVDVTSQVKAAGAGSYTVANVLSTPNLANVDAGWSLVVVINDPQAPPRNLTVIDGLQSVQGANPTVSFTVSGFQTPPSGPVTTRLGVVTYDGDAGFTGDSFQLNGTTLTDATHPANNFFNSSISRNGANVATRAPAYVNQLGFDATIVNVPANVIKNGDTSANIVLTTNNDGYFPGVLTFVTDLYDPVIKVDKQVKDLNGGDVVPGDILEYTLTAVNSGQDAALNVIMTDPIPAGSSYVLNSLRISNTVKTDVANDYQAEYLSTGPPRTVFRLGSGATATVGGRLAAAGSSASASFQVRVDSNTPHGTQITNQAQITFRGETRKEDLIQNSLPAQVIVIARADLAITKTDGQTTATPGRPIVYTVKVTNNGPQPVTGARLSDTVPGSITGVKWTCSVVAGSSCGAAS